MKVLIVTPLYPPDTSSQAQYIKELAQRLHDLHSNTLLTILTYGACPEEINGVAIRTVRRMSRTPLRIIYFIVALWKEILDADIVFLENGPSVEVPFLLVSFFRARRYIFHYGDQVAHTRAKHSVILKMIDEFLTKRSAFIFASSPMIRPEILPFLSHPENELLQYETSWVAHLQEIDKKLYGK